MSFSVAIDGPAGAGKSTVARAVAQTLNAAYLDTGAMYRTFGLYMLRRGITDPEAVARAVNEPDISVRFENGVQHMLLDGEDVTEAIRMPDVSMGASLVAAVPAVRERLVALQREIAAGHDVVMDGRDIGTAVLPDATLKIYLTASPETRAERRCRELKEAGREEPYEKVLEEILRRDYNDMHRAASPLRQAEDAVNVDSSHLTREETIGTIAALAKKAAEGMRA